MLYHIHVIFIYFYIYCSFIHSYQYNTGIKNYQSFKFPLFPFKKFVSNDFSIASAIDSFDILPLSLVSSSIPSSSIASSNVQSFSTSPTLYPSSSPTSSPTSSPISSPLPIAPYEDIIVYLSEHIQISDQILLLGAHNDLAYQLLRDGYGLKKTGFMTIIDENIENIQSLQSLIMSDITLNPYIKENKIQFHVFNSNNLKDICKQSYYDSIIDNNALDSILQDSILTSIEKKDKFLFTIDNLQNTVRLGNILVSLSKLPKDQFCINFEERFGWIQELDGDPGEISAWYRGKTNIQASQSNFGRHGLKMYVYTNTFNC